MHENVNYIWDAQSTMQFLSLHDATYQSTWLNTYKHMNAWI